MINHFSHVGRSVGRTPPHEQPDERGHEEQRVEDWDNEDHRGDDCEHGKTENEDAPTQQRRQVCAQRASKNLEKALLNPVQVGVRGGDDGLHVGEPEQHRDHLGKRNGGRRRGEMLDVQRRQRSSELQPSEHLCRLRKAECAEPYREQARRQQPDGAHHGERQPVAAIQ